MAEARSIEIESGREGRERSLVRLPLVEAEFSFTCGPWWKRLLSVGAVAWAGMCLLLPLLVTGGRPGRLFHFPSDPLVLIIWLIMLCFLALFTIGGWVMAGGTLLGFFPMHIDIEVQDDETVVCRRQGPWKHRRHIEGVRRLHILPPAKPGPWWLNKPLAERTSRLFAERENGRFVRIVLDRPHAIARQTAIALSDLICQHAGCDALLVIDQVDPAQRQMDADSPPPRIEYCVSRNGQNTLIAPVNHTSILRGLLRSGLFRSGVWTAVLPYLLLIGVNRLRPDLLEPWVATRVALTIGAVGLIFMAAAWYDLALRRLYLITAEGLATVTDLRIWRHIKSWKRSEIAAIRLGQRIASQGQHVDVLELILSAGQSADLESGSFRRLQHLATLLREELNVPAEAPASSDGTATSPPPR